MLKLETCYDVFGIEKPFFTIKELKRNRRRCLATIHPDKANTENPNKLSDFKRELIETCYEILADAQRKDKYDALLETSYNKIRLDKLRIKFKQDYLKVLSEAVDGCMPIDQQSAIDTNCVRVVTKTQNENIYLHLIATDSRLF